MKKPIRRFRKRTYKKTPKVSRQVNYAVSKALNSKIERKEKIFQFNSIGGNNGNTATATIIPVSFNSISFGSGAAVASLFAGLPYGGGQEGQRIGNQVIANSINISLYLQPGDDTNYMRFLLVRPRQNQNLTSPTNFLESVLTGNGSSVTQFGAPVDTNNFKIYMDKSIFFTKKPLDGATSTSIVTSYHLQHFMRIKSKIQYDQVTKYPLKDYFLIGISDSVAVSHPGAIAGYVKITYQDA